eukprot:TRINITY_DN10468_c0_g1_i2.p1 TRINITY_DN10468_c0_g1~~TRINITY_DN10468_c0_g1_i2.p1  ORF type:complete len:329 (-),score=59.10 TRINITY_DN10468_c0_g1_i2:273-1259(-)
MSAVKLSELPLGDKASNGFKKATIVTLLCAVVMYVIAVIFNALAGSNAVEGLFQATVGDLSDKYDLPITPAGFTFSIWSLIYIWLTVSLVIFLVTLFIRNQYGRLYLNPPFMNPLLNTVMFINFALNLTWIFLWDREVIIGSAIILILLAITNITIIAIMARNLYLYQESYKRGSEMYKWGIIYRVIVNGFGIYTTWTVIAALINFTHALVYGGGVDKKTASLTALSLLLIFHVTYYILDSMIFCKYIWFLVTPFMVVIWALNGIRAAIVNRKEEGEDPDQQITDFVTGLLIVASISLGIQLLFRAKMIYTAIRDPASKRRICATQDQ